MRNLAPLHCHSLQLRHGSSGIYVRRKLYKSIQTHKKLELYNSQAPGWRTSDNFALLVFNSICVANSTMVIAINDCAMCSCSSEVAGQKPCGIQVQSSIVLRFCM